MKRFIELKNGLKFMIISTLVLDEVKYLYLASVTEDIKYIFAKVINEKIIEPVKDTELISKLMSLFVEKIKNQIINVDVNE